MKFIETSTTFSPRKLNWAPTINISFLKHQLETPLTVVFTQQFDLFTPCVTVLFEGWKCLYLLLHHLFWSMEHLIKIKKKNRLYSLHSLRNLFKSWHKRSCLQLYSFDNFVGQRISNNLSFSWRIFTQATSVLVPWGLLLVKITLSLFVIQ